MALLFVFTYLAASSLERLVGKGRAPRLKGAIGPWAAVGKSWPARAFWLRRSFSSWKLLYCCKQSREVTIKRLPTGPIRGGKTAAAPEKNEKRKNKAGTMMNTLSYLVFILGVSLLLAGFFIYVANDVFAFVKEEHVVVLDLPDNASHSEVATMLKDEGVIQCKRAFKLYAALSTDSDTFKSGKFEVSSDMDYGQIINTLNRVATYTEMVDVTIPEGYTIQQIAELLEESRVCGADDLIETANTYPFKHEFLQDVPMEENRLEGFLFPDTYQFYVNDSTVRVLNTMLNNFNNKYTDEMRELTANSGSTMREILAVASMVEREAKLPEERATHCRRHLQPAEQPFGIPPFGYRRHCAICFG